jgi:ribosomal-protein-alanine N-acetyltransferase
MFLLGEDKILGWAIFKLIPADHLAHLLKILILPDYRGNKLGLTLLKNAISQLEGDKYLKFYLEVEKGNPAISIYKRLGFSIIHEIPNFYGMGRNAIVMMRQS